MMGASLFYKADYPPISDALEDEGTGGNFGRRIYCVIDGVEGRGEGCIDVGVEGVWMLIVLGNFRLGED